MHLIAALYIRFASHSYFLVLPLDFHSASSTTDVFIQPMHMRNMDFTLPVRNRKDLNRAAAAAQVQALRAGAGLLGPPHRRRTASSSDLDFESAFFDKRPLSPDPYLRDVGDALFSRQAATQSSYRNSAYASAAPPGYQRLPLRAAAQNLAGALHHAVDYCEPFERSFASEMKAIERYASPKVIEVLWTQKMDWNGQYPKPPKGVKAPPPPIIETFAGTKSKLHKGLADMRVAIAAQSQRMGFPSSSDAGEGFARRGEKGVGKEVRERADELKLVLRKLALSCQAIVEMLDAVRTTRSRMPALVKELISTENLLIDNQELWAAEPRRATTRETEAEEEGPCFD